jgi:hypothetical protein
MRLVIGLAGMLAAGLALQQGRAQSPEKPLAVSLCEVKAHPENFLHKLIEVTATASHGFEDSMVEDSQCPWPNGGPGVWMEYGGTRSTDTMYCCGFSPKPDRAKTLVVEGMSLDLVDDETFKEFDKRLHPQHSKPKRGSDTVRATMRGRTFVGLRAESFILPIVTSSLSTAPWEIETAHRPSPTGSRFPVAQNPDSREQPDFTGCFSGESVWCTQQLR